MQSQYNECIGKAQTEIDVKKKKPEPIPVPRIHHLSSPEVQEAQETCPHTHTHTHTYTVSGIGSVMESCSKWYWNWYWKYHWKSRATFNHVGWSGLRRIQLGSTIWFRYVFQVLLFFCDFLFFQNFQIFRYWKPEGRDKNKNQKAKYHNTGFPPGIVPPLTWNTASSSRREGNSCKLYNSERRGERIEDARGRCQPPPAVEVGYRSDTGCLSVWVTMVGVLVCCCCSYFVSASGKDVCGSVFVAPRPSRTGTGYLRETSKHWRLALVPGSCP